MAVYVCVAQSVQRHLRLHSAHLLHLPAHVHGAVGLVYYHIGPAHEITGGDRSGDLPAVRQTERQGASRE